MPQGAPHRPGHDHLPVNHPSRPFWRVLAFLTGGYILVFGIVGMVRSLDEDLDWFAQDDLPNALGLHANPGFSLMSIVVGAVVAIASIIGHNVDRYVDLAGGTVFLLAGLAMLALLRSDVNYLGFTMTTCIVSFVLGLIMLSAGLFCRVGPPEQEAAEEHYRHHGFE